MAEIIDENVENQTELIEKALLHKVFGSGYALGGGSKYGNSLLKQKKYQKIREFVKYLPSINYVANQTVRYIMADGITFENPDDTEKFKQWLAKPNLQDETNKSVLNKGLFNSLIFGHSGIRMLSETDGWIYVEPDHYGRVTAPSAKYGNVRVPIAYIVSEKKKINKDISAEELVKYGFEFLRDDKQITPEILAKNWLETEKLDISNSLETHTLLPTTKLLNLSISETADYRDSSPFLREEGRLYLLYVALKRIAEDVEYDGLGTLLFKIDTDLLKEMTTENGLSSGTIIKQGQTARNVMNKDVEENAKKIADDLSKARRNNSIVMNPNIDFVKQLASDTRAVELLDYASKYAGSVMAEALGISPRFLQLMQTSSDISMDATFKEGMRNAIIPLREQLLSQIDDFVADELDIKSEMVFNVPAYLDTMFDDNKKVADTYNAVMKVSDRPEIADMMATYLQTYLDPEDAKKVANSVADAVSTPAK